MTSLSLFRRRVRPDPASSRDRHPVEPPAPRSVVRERILPIGSQRYQATVEEGSGTLTDRVLTFLDKRSA